MYVRSFHMYRLVRSWAGTFVVAGLLAGCAASGDMKMPSIRLSSFWPAGQGLSAAAPAAPVQKPVVPEIAKPKLVPVLPPPAPTAAVIPVAANAMPGPIASVAPVESESLPAPEAREPAMPGWMRPKEDAGRQVIRFSSMQAKPSLMATGQEASGTDVAEAADQGRIVAMPANGVEVVPVPAAPVAATSGAGMRHAALLVPAGALGDAMRQAASLAVFDVQKAGFELRPYETGPEGASVAVRKALADGADVLLGPVFATDAQEAKPLAQAAHVPMVTFSTDWTLAGNGTYVFGFLPFTQVVRVVGYAGEQGVRRLAVLAPQGPYGDAVVETARWQAARLGMAVSGIGRYDETPGSLQSAVAAISDFPARSAALADVRLQLQSRRDAQAQAYLAQLVDAKGYGPLPCDAVLVAQGGERMPDVLAALAGADLVASNVHLLGTGLWDDAALWTQPVLEGAWYAAPAPGLRQDFMARYRSTFGEVPPRLATLAYDATALAMTLVDMPGGAVAGLQSTEGFIGIDGIFRFRNNGLVERGLPVLEIGQGAARIVSPAPTSFRPAGQ